ncbi:MAG: DUF1080 domain-containing protein [Chitinophagaceae bacterium]|nr:DUF1080 domain-containing protein [Chitinophagaceae bacterium]
MQLFSAIPVLAVALLVSTPEKKVPVRMPVQQEKGWISLFDGTTTKGWHTFGKTFAGEAWKVADGTLYLDASNKANWQTKGGGDIVSDDAFENFHLKLDWKISKNGNSGVIFWVQDDPAKYAYTWHTGPEMQVLDNDGHSDGKINKHRAGNLYDLIAGKEDAVNPVGEWNTAEIISNKGKLDFILNGITVLSTTYGDDNWKQLIAGSKFKPRPDFGTNFKGHIALQDHGNDVWYKNIMIKKL